MADDNFIVSAPIEGIKHAVTPAAPPAGTLQLYAKTSDRWFQQTSGGVETEVGVPSGGAALSFLRKHSGTNYDTEWGTFVDASAPTAVGPGATIGTNGLAYGGSSSAAGTNAIAIGQSASTTSGDSPLALGVLAAAAGDNAIALGRSAASAANDAIGIGHGVNAEHIGSISIGGNTATHSDYSVSIGFGSSTTSSGHGDGGIALGANTQSLHGGGVALGTDHAFTGAVTTAQDDFVLGTALHTVRVPGTFKVKTMTYPTADGSPGQVMKTDGAGTLSFATVVATTQRTFAYWAA